MFMKGTRFNSIDFDLLPVDSFIDFDLLHSIHGTGILIYPGSQLPFKKWWFLLEDDKPLLK